MRKRPSPLNTNNPASRMGGLWRLTLAVLLASVMSACGGGSSGSGTDAPAADPGATVPTVRVVQQVLAVADTAGIESRFHLENFGKAAYTDAVTYYFFEAPEGKHPVLETAEDGASPAELQSLGGRRYRVKFTFNGIRLPAGGRWPLDDEYRFQLYWTDATPWKSAEDVSGIAPDPAAAINERMPVYDLSGKLLSARQPPEDWLPGNAAAQADAPEQIQAKSTGPDTVRPVMSFEPFPETTTSASVEISGSAVDRGSGIASIKASMPSRPGQPLILTLDPDGRFSFTATLIGGLNTVAVNAFDGAGNSRIIKALITRQMPAVAIAVDSPALDALVNADSLISDRALVAGRITADPDELLVVKVKNIQTPATPGATPGQFTFAIRIKVDPGLNEFSATVTASGSSASAPVRMFVDSAKPVLTVDSQAAPTINTSSVLITGTARDNHQLGLITIDSSCCVGSTFSGSVDAGGRYSIEVPLAYGLNTIKVTATDAAGNFITRKIELTRPNLRLSITSPSPGDRTNQPSIDIAGTVIADPGAELVLTQGRYSQAPVATAVPGQYTFLLPAVALKPGSNVLSVTLSASAGKIKKTVEVFYDAPANNDTSGPQITVLAPQNNELVSESPVTVTGTVSDPSGVSELKITGKKATLIGASRTQMTFERAIDLPAAGSKLIDLVATDAKGNLTTLNFTVRRDSIAPVVMISAPQPSNGLLRGIDDPMAISGTVQDADLAGFSVNGSPVQLLPGATGSYQFSTRVAAPAGIDTPLELLAWDTAGNQTRKQYTVRNQAQAQVELIEPRDGASLMIGDGNEQLSLVVRVTAGPPGAVVTAELAAQNVTLTPDGNSYTGSISAAGLTGEQVLKVKLKSAGGQVLSTASSRITLTDIDNIPLSVSRFDPPSGAREIESNVPITIYFSKPLEDPEELEVTVTETVHGESFDPDNIGGVLPVNRDQEQVPGSLAITPDGSAAIFYADRELAYGADLQIKVEYDGDELARSAFNTRALPTLLHGLISDQYNNELQGITVEMPDLGLTAVTDADGNYNFGFGSDATRLTPGRQRIVFNPGMKNPLLGTVTAIVTVQARRLTRVPVVHVPVIDTGVPFVRVQSGQQTAVMGNSGLTLKLGQAEILFPDNRQQGNLHAQFMTPAQAGVGSQPASMPLWMFAMQPAEVQVSGNTGVEIEPPKLYGSYNYLPVEGSYVMLIGQDAASRQLKPVGVAVMQNQRMVSQGAVQLENLNYIGVQIVTTQRQAILADYAEGRITLVEMTRRLSP